MKQIVYKDKFVKVDQCQNCDLGGAIFCSPLKKKITPFEIDKDCPLQEWGYGQWINTENELPHPKEWVEVVFAGKVYIAQLNEKTDEWQIEGKEYTVIKEAIKKWRRIILPPEGK